jgi:hypothetical protein
MGGTAKSTHQCSRCCGRDVAQAFRWREMLENGTHSTIAEIAAAEKINESYVGRVPRLTLLALDIVEAMLNGRQPALLKLADLLRPFPTGWSEQQWRSCAAPPDLIMSALMSV